MATVTILPSRKAPAAAGFITCRVIDVPPPRWDRARHEHTDIHSSASGAAPRPAPQRWLGRAGASRWAPLPIVLAGTFMVVLDFFIVNVALPSIQGGLHASSGSIEWIVAGYGLTSAVFLITAGRLGDR